MSDIQEIKDMVTMLAVSSHWSKEAARGAEWEVVILPEGSLGRVPEDGALPFKVRQSKLVEKGRIIFCNTEGAYK